MTLWPCACRRRRFRPRLPHSSFRPCSARHWRAGSFRRSAATERSTGVHTNCRAYVGEPFQCLCAMGQRLLIRRVERCAPQHFEAILDPVGLRFFTDDQGGGTAPLSFRAIGGRPHQVAGIERLPAHGARRLGRRLFSTGQQTLSRRRLPGPARAGLRPLRISTSVEKHLDLWWRNGICPSGVSVSVPTIWSMTGSISPRASSGCFTTVCTLSSSDRSAPSPYSASSARTAAAGPQSQSSRCCSSCFCTARCEAGSPRSARNCGSIRIVPRPLHRSASVGTIL